MMRLKALFVALLSIAAIAAVAATSASAALPALLLLPEGKTTSELKYTCPPTLNFELRGAIVIKGEGCLFQFFITADMQQAGEGDTLFLNASLAGTKCNTTGDATGEVLVPVEWHFALGLGSPEAEKLFLALVSVKGEITITCGLTKIKIRGGQLVDMKPFKEEVKAGGTVTALALCNTTTNKSLWTEYDNEEGGMTTAKLEANGGLGFEPACELVVNTIPLVPTEMLEVMEP